MNASYLITQSYTLNRSRQGKGDLKWIPLTLGGDWADHNYAATSMVYLWCKDDDRSEFTLL